MPRLGTGNPEAKIMLVSDCFTRDDETGGEAFLGKAGEELNKMLSEAGIMRGDCYTTSLYNARPHADNLGSFVHYTRKNVPPGWTPLRNFYCAPTLHHSFQRLFKEITLIKPKVIIALGNMAMWALTGATGILKWRGSVLILLDENSKEQEIVVIPSLPPNQVLYAPENRAMVVSDLRRAAYWVTQPSIAKPGSKWNFCIRPSFPRVMHVLNGLLLKLDSGVSLWIDFDLETRAGHISCAGISWSTEEALCIPLMCVDNFDGYWSLQEEGSIVFELYKLLTHKNVKVRGQNLLYDCQYTYRHWHYVPRVVQDTMISHHTCFAGLPKSLAFQASIYCDDYVNWKPDKVVWKQGG